jgi:hypothetical protein
MFKCNMVIEKTIENALDKSLVLRGEKYIDIRNEPERKRMG